MMSKQRICLWCTSSPYSWEFVQEFNDEFDITSIAIQYADSSFDYDYTIKIKNPIRLRLLSTLFNLLFVVPYLAYLVAKYDKKCDCHIIHYLSDIIALAMFLVNPKKPIVYFTYGSDYRYPKLKRIFRNILVNKINLIMSGSPYVKEELIKYYEVNNSIVDTTLTFKVNKSFRKLNYHDRDRMRKNFGINNDEIVIFSPRALKHFYNHHILIEAIKLLNNNLKKKIKVILIRYGDEKYINILSNICKKAKLNNNIIFINKILTPSEMAKIYNISDITVSIPMNDGIGRCNVEAMLCGSIVLLSDRIKNYKILFRDGRHCKYSKPTPDNIAKAIEYIVKNINILRDKKEIIRIARFINWRRNKQQIVNRIKGIVTNKEGSK